MALNAISFLVYCSMDAALHAQIQRGGGVQTPHPENHKIIGFLSNAGPDPLANHIATCTKLQVPH